MIQQIINNKRIYNNLVKEKNERKLKLNTTNAITTTNNDIVISIEDEEKTNDERGEKNNNGSEDYYVLEKGYDDNNSEDSGDEGDNNYKVPPEVEQLNDFRTSVELLTFRQNKIESKLLSEYNIVEGSHIQLMVLLYSISKDQSLNNLTTLNYGSTGHVDLKCISHSGDVMDFANKKGHHRTTVDLSSLPSNVT
ncbi:14630_t:CDS:2 [Entrophospora sp. SA101]|nr:14625_t:CDS:2 [Entrophospora sp. SA101]CAJ0636204.1 14630_t:CDS:2 [Entrophospora sp. SA101]